MGTTFKLSDIKLRKSEVDRCYKNLRDGSNIHTKITHAGGLSEIFQEESFHLPEKRVNLFCGQNGVGKTQILKFLSISLKNKNKNLTIRNGKNIENLSQDITVLKDIIYYDMHFSSEIKDLLSETDNIETIVEEIEPRELEAKELEILSHLANKEYKSIKMYEVSKETLPEGISNNNKEIDKFYYFDIKYKEINYSTPKMGMGEYAVFHLFFLLTNLRTGTSLFLEEPENFLTPITQNRLMDVLLNIVEKKKIIVYLSSHSPYIVRKVPKECVVSISNINGKIELNSKKNLEIILNELGLDINLKGIIFVEDYVAKEMVKALLKQKISTSFLKKYEVVIAKDESTIKKIKDANLKGDKLKILYFYDGDMKGKHPKEENVFFLPGKEPLEKEAKFIANEKIEDLSKSYSIALDDLKSFLVKVEGIEKHEWLEEVKNELDIEKKDFVNKISSYIFEKYKEEVSILISELKSSICD